MPKINITNLGRPELRTESALVSEAPSPESTIGNTSAAGVLIWPNDDWILLEEEEWNEGFSSDESGLEQLRSWEMSWILKLVCYNVLSKIF